MCGVMFVCIHAYILLVTLGVFMHLLYVNMQVSMCAFVCICACMSPAYIYAFVHTVQSTMVMCLAAVLASTSASSSLTLFSTDISRGLFSAGIRQDSYLHRSDYTVLENTEQGQRHEQWQGAQEKRPLDITNWHMQTKPNTQYTVFSTLCVTQQ